LDGFDRGHWFKDWGQSLGIYYGSGSGIGHRSNNQQHQGNNYETGAVSQSQENKSEKDWIFHDVNGCRWGFHQNERKVLVVP
jgi:hypothetical protein